MNPSSSSSDSSSRTISFKKRQTCSSRKFRAGRNGTLQHVNSICRRFKILSQFLKIITNCQKRMFVNLRSQLLDFIRLKEILKDLILIRPFFERDYFIRLKTNLNQIHEIPHAIDVMRHENL